MPDRQPFPGYRPGRGPLSRRGQAVANSIEASTHAYSRAAARLIKLANLDFYPIFPFDTALLPDAEDSDPIYLRHLHECEEWWQTADELARRVFIQSDWNPNG